ncbi:MAG: L,D-transpeptidase [Proteobacteria bacterium]|nr:L,D-transpeptidase [Pseudomonadota bacterium]
MNKLLKIAAAALAAAFISTAAQADDSLYGSAAGAIIVPASTSIYDVDASSMFPSVKRGQIVEFKTSKKRGSIIISTQKNELYFVLGYGKAVKYRVATARTGFEWAGTHKVSAKTEWPDWRPPVEMRARHPELPAFMAGGPKNPLGARAMYLGSSIYRIHGTNEPKSIGKAASSGCIRMLNADVTELYKLVKVGAEVTVL